MPPLGAAIEPLGVQHQVHLIGAGSSQKLKRPLPRRSKRFRILAPAFEAGPVASGERGHLVHKKQLGVIAAPDVALAALEIQHAADPLPRRPAPAGQLLVVGVEASAAIAQEQAARGRSEQLAKRIDAVLQGHIDLRDPDTESPALAGDDSINRCKRATPQDCGCGSIGPVPSGRGRLLPAGGTADERGVCGSITDSRVGFLPSSRSLISSPDSVSNSSRPLASTSRSARLASRMRRASLWPSSTSRLTSASIFCAVDSETFCWRATDMPRNTSSWFSP